MRKSILYSLFKLGGIPSKIYAGLQQEGIVLADQGLRASVTYKKFRAPGRAHSFRQSAFTGSLVVTEKRFAAFMFAKRMLNVPLGSTKISDLDISVPNQGLLIISFDVAKFHDNWSGSVTYRFHTDKANMFLERIS